MANVPDLLSLFVGCCAPTVPVQTNPSVSTSKGLFRVVGPSVAMTRAARAVHPAIIENTALTPALTQYKNDYEAAGYASQPVPRIYETYRHRTYVRRKYFHLIGIIVKDGNRGRNVKNSGGYDDGYSVTGFAYTRPVTAIAARHANICHFRSHRSANVKAMTGPIGNTAAPKSE